MIKVIYSIIIVCRTNGLTDQRAVGPTGCRTNGHVGPTGCRTNGLSDQRAVGPTGCRTKEQTPWYQGIIHLSASILICRTFIACKVDIFVPQPGYKSEGQALYLKYKADHLIVQPSKIIKEYCDLVVVHQLFNIRSIEVSLKPCDQTS